MDYLVRAPGGVALRDRKDTGIAIAMATAEYRWRHLALLISILLLFVSAPFVVSLHDGILIMNVISVSVLVAGSYALSERKYLFAIAVVLSAITIVGTGLVLAFQQTWALVVSSSSIIVLVAFFCVTILSYVLGSGRVTSGHLRLYAAWIRLEVCLLDSSRAAAGIVCLYRRTRPQ